MWELSSDFPQLCVCLCEPMCAFILFCEFFFSLNIVCLGFFLTSRVRRCGGLWQSAAASLLLLENEAHVRERMALPRTSGETDIQSDMFAQPEGFI